MFPHLRILCCWLLLALPQLAAAQPAAATKRQPRILLLVDGSSSMLNPWQQGVAGPDRFHTAARVISALVDSIYAINPGVEFGLRVYGHQYPAQDRNCHDTRREVSFSKDNRAQLALRMASLHPAGVSPIAWSLQEAAENDLVDEARNAYSIILITDGGESCGGDICAVARMLLEKKIFFQPYVLALAAEPGLKTQYDCLGKFLTAGDEPGVTSSIRTIINDYRPLLQLPEMVTAPPVPAPAPSRPVNTGLIVTPPPPRPRVTLLPPLNLPQTALALQASLQPLNLREARESVPPAPVFTKPARPVAVVDTARPVLKPVQPVPVPVPVPVPAPKPTPKPVVTQAQTPTPTPRKPVPVPKPSTSDLPPARVETQDDKETSFAVYFTDGHGTYYHTSPELRLTNKATGQTTKFVRTLDAYDEPRFQSIEAGNYTLVVPSRSGSVTRSSDVTIVANKKNKVEIVVRNGTITFAYEENPDRPVKEYDAEIRVSVTQSRSRIITQHCDTELYFPPETYHLEINTLPETVLMADVDFNSVTVIMLPEPGYLEITNRNHVGRVGLFVTRGGIQQWVRFHEVEVNGNLPEQVVRLNPGSYQLRYGNPANETIVPFFIKSNERTSQNLQ